MFCWLVLVIYSHKKNLWGLDPGEKNCSAEGGRPKSFVNMRGRCVRRSRDLGETERSDLKAGANVVPGGMDMAKRAGVGVGRRTNLVKAGADEAAAEVLAVVVWKAGVPGVNVEAKVGRKIAAVEV